MTVARARRSPRSSARCSTEVNRLLDELAADEPDFGAWLERVTPSWQWRWPHLVRIRASLDRVTRGECRRLMIACPPRHGKSAQVTVRYPVWRLERKPTLRIIVGSYSSGLAETFSRQARRIAESRLRLAADRAAAEDWDTASGGGMRAVGVGAGVTGHGAHVVVVDDPVKNREEAESEAYRERVWNWYKDDLYTRLEPGGAVILIATRWHEDDLPGRLLAEMENGGERWEVLNLPALAEDGDPLGRPVGAALCPDRYPVEELERIRDVLGSYSFAALYQQRPAPREGGMFKRAWFEKVDAAPIVAEFVRYWDKAATVDGGDWTVGVLMGKDQDAGRYYVLDVVRGQWGSGERDGVMLETARKDAERYGEGVRIYAEQEPGSGGKDSAEATVRLLAGFPVRCEPSTGTKVVRADPFAAQAEAGNVKLLRAPWNAAYLDELGSFPSGRYDDQVDASSGAFNKLAASVPWAFY